MDDTSPARADGSPRDAIARTGREAGLDERVRLVAFDLDDTLAPSKSSLPAPMSQHLAQLLELVPVGVVSGGHFPQFELQLLDGLRVDETLLPRLHLMPTCGTQYVVRRDGAWHTVYAEDLTAAQKSDAFAAVESAAKRLGLWEPALGGEVFGDILEDRGSQITFSALGQQAPVELKRAWDPDGAKKVALRTAAKELLPELEVRAGGSTSIDITRRGIDKAYGMTRLSELTGIPLGSMVFVGDRLDPDGNDFPVTTLPVRCVAVDGWEDTAAFIAAFVEARRR